MTFKIKVIKTEEDYKGALELVGVLMAENPNPESTEGEQLSILATLIQDYESKTFPDSLPDPVEAILFRMEQMDLKYSDLIPYLGSKSRVSEILSGERQLTVEMMRALEIGLGIPAKVLLRKPEIKESSIFSNWNKKLLKEMDKRGYFGNTQLTDSNGSTLVKNFFSSIQSPMQLQVLLRQSSYRSAPTTDHQALAVWSEAVLKKAKQVKIEKKYKEGSVTLEFMQKIVKLSVKDDSPIAVQEHLKEHGIILIIEPHFPKTRLDGATILMNETNPIIGLTLRHDRLDNFWFTLMHELAHIALHYNQNINLFYDELEDTKGIEIDPKEHEADELASEALVPGSKWEVSPARMVPSSLAANSLARDLSVHVAIVAGKIRYTGGKYYYLNNLVGQAKVRRHFTNITWNE